MPDLDPAGVEAAARAISSVRYTAARQRANGQFVDERDEFKRMALAAAPYLRAIPESDEPRMSAEVEAILDRRNHRDLLLADALKDLCWKATPFTTDDAESITSYVVPAGTLHRLAGQAQQFAADFKVTVVFRAAEVLSPDEAAGGE